MRFRVLLPQDFAKFSPVGVMSSFASFGRVFAEFFQKAQQRQPFVF